MNYQKIKILLINKISVKFAEQGIDTSQKYYGDWKEKLQSYDKLSDIFNFCWQIKKHLCDELNEPQISYLDFCKEDLPIFFSLLDKEVIDKEKEINSSQDKITSLQNDLTAKDSELTNKEKQIKDLEQQVSSGKEQISSLINDKKKLEQEHKDLIAKLTNSIDKNDYENIKNELQRERERERTKSPRTRRTSHHRYPIMRNPTPQ